LVLNNPTLAENTHGLPQSRSPATAQREARGHSALLPPATYTICWDTIIKWGFDELDCYRSP
jgi:hypothetical protein